jgi:hypothetical protein
VRLPVGAVQFKEGAGERGRVRGDEPQVGTGDAVSPKTGSPSASLHVGHESLGLAAGQFGHVEAEFRGERQDHRGRDRAVVVLHLVQIGQRDAKLFGEGPLREREPRARFAELGAGIEFAVIDMDFANPMSGRNYCKAAVAVNCARHCGRCRPPARAA